MVVQVLVPSKLSSAHLTIVRLGTIVVFWVSLTQVLQHNLAFGGLVEGGHRTTAALVGAPVPRLLMLIVVLLTGLALELVQTTVATHHRHRVVAEHVKIGREVVVAVELQECFVPGVQITLQLIQTLWCLPVVKTVHQRGKVGPQTAELLGARCVADDFREESLATWDEEGRPRRHLGRFMYSSQVNIT